MFCPGPTLLGSGQNIQLLVWSQKCSNSHNLQGKVDRCDCVVCAATAREQSQNNNKKHLNDVHVDCDISTGVDG